jgi:hypothetical protein
MSPIYVPGKVVLRQTWQPMDADAAAYITAVETADGQALEEKTKIAIDNFVVGCKADGIWSAIKASCILAGARTLSGALVPLVGTAPTNFNFVAGDYNRKTGLVGNGSTKYLDSNRADNANGITSKHFGVFVTTNSASSESPIGNNVSTYGAAINLRAAGSLIDIYFNAGFARVDVLAPSAPFFVGASRNGTALSGIAGPNSAIATNTASLNTSVNNFIFARNNGSAANNYTSSRLAFYTFGESLNLVQLGSRVTDLINAFAAAIP